MVTTLEKLKYKQLNKESKKRLLLDLDGVVVKYDFPKIVKDFFGVDLSNQAIFAYDLADVLGVSPLMINAMFNKQVWGKPEFIDGSLETLKSWDKYEIIIYSNRVKYMGAENLARWLIDYKIPFNGIDNGDNKYYAHIDDSPSKLASTHSKLKILFTQSWNTRCLDIQNQFTRVYSWEEIGKMI